MATSMIIGDDRHPYVITHTADGDELGTMKDEAAGINTVLILGIQAVYCNDSVLHGTLHDYIRRAGYSISFVVYFSKRGPH
jgi:hypothetical protein